MKYFKLFLVMVICFASLSCVARSINIVDETCTISDYYFTSVNDGETELVFKDNGACEYKLRPLTDRAWLIYIPNVYIADFEPQSDDWADKYIRYIKRTEAGVEIYFNSQFYAYEKLYKRNLLWDYGYKPFIFKKKDVAFPEKKAKIIKSVYCLDDPFTLKIDLDGAVAYNYGRIDTYKSYIDIYDVGLADDFKYLQTCKNVLQIKELPFPNRIRVLLGETQLLFPSVYGERHAVYVEDDLHTKKAPPTYDDRTRYILDIVEEIHADGQVLRFYTSEVPRELTTEEDNGRLIIDLHGGFKPVLQLDREIVLNGKVFATAKFSPDGDKIILSLLNTDANAEFYMEKSDYGFVIYSKY